MTTLHGFLSQQFPEPPRLTHNQKGLILNAVQLLASRLLPEIAAKLATLPDDRSCFSCDFLHPGTQHCRKWGQDVPDRTAMNSGCSAWQDHGTPF